MMRSPEILVSAIPDGAYKVVGFPGDLVDAREVVRIELQRKDSEAASRPMRRLCACVFTSSQYSDLGMAALSHYPGI
jgi:hypothetical protein